MDASTKNRLLSPKFVLPLIVLLALAVRLTNLTTTSLWIDEIYSLMVANVHWPPYGSLPILYSAQGYYDEFLSWQPMDWGVLLELLKANVHMPLYYLLLNPWLKMVGNTEFGLRSFSVAFSVLMLIPVYFLGKALGKKRRAGWMAAFIAAIIPFQIYQAQEGRMYTLLLFWTCLSALSFWKTLYAERPLGWSLLYAASTALGMFTHYLFVFFLGFQGIYALIWLLRGKNGKRFAFFGFALAALGAIALNWGPIYQIQQQGVNEEYHFAKGLVDFSRYVGALFWQPLVMVTGDNRLERIFYIPVTLGLLGVVFWKAFRSGFAYRREGFLLLWLWTPLVLQIAYDLLKQTHTTVIDRYVMLISPAMILLLALGLNQLWVWGKQRAASVLMALMLFLAVANVWAPSPFRDEHNKKDIRGMITHMVQHSGPKDLVFVNGPFGSANLAAWYYTQQRPEQPVLYWMNRFNGRPAPLPDFFLFNRYERVWLFRNRANNERGLQQAKDFLRGIYPHVEYNEKTDWFLYSRKGRN